MSESREILEDETGITEITLQPDGRVYVFGASRQVLEILEALQPGDEHLRQLLMHVREMERESESLLGGGGEDLSFATEGKRVPSALPLKN